MSVAGSCFLQWTQKILTINKKLSRYIPPSYFCFKPFLFFFFFQITIRSLITCYKLHRHCSERSISFSHCVRNITRSVVDFSANTSTRHTKASCNENRFNFRRYYISYLRSRRIGHKKRENKIKIKKVYIYISQNYTHDARLLGPILYFYIVFVYCMRQSSAFGIKKSTYISHRLAASSATFPRKRTVGVKKVQTLFLLMHPISIRECAFRG